ncbi:hypothetical protein HPB51_019856 [Rhipicephalus microplus]|uniref:Ferritin n=1 Tax=Rhipicephalus microplus TaxID=6941 RepID=A0A9J6DBH4_RHIMP|nr:hypothetical protein HPB51_019856 [Rhipicephalus microplus]
MCCCFGRLGHCMNMCPNSKDKVCRGIDAPNPGPDHQCSSCCKLCEGAHMTTDCNCHAKYKTIYIMKKTQWERRRATEEPHTETPKAELHRARIRKPGRTPTRDANATDSVSFADVVKGKHAANVETGDKTNAKMETEIAQLTETIKTLRKQMECMQRAPAMDPGNTGLSTPNEAAHHVARGLLHRASPEDDRPHGAAHLANNKVARGGFARFFRDQSSEEREHAQKIIDYLNLRGGTVSAMPPTAIWMSVLDALQAALALEHRVTNRLYELHRLAEEYDAQAAAQSLGPNESLGNNRNPPSTQPRRRRGSREETSTLWGGPIAHRTQQLTERSASTVPDGVIRRLDVQPQYQTATTPGSLSPKR